MIQRPVLLTDWLCPLATHDLSWPLTIRLGIIRRLCTYHEGRQLLERPSMSEFELLGRLPLSLAFEEGALHFATAQRNHGRTHAVHTQSPAHEPTHKDTGRVSAGSRKSSFITDDTGRIHTPDQIDNVNQSPSAQ